ncbi:STAS domain-containing protein [Ideonella sp. 4Y16]|uniref:STAS domain-containing protein n=1 Tax=Ideonella alba TaxID=2824118 RepID=A0A940YFA3_9BURK|nr:SulP family inorganic anion transporter [Ideonella alba]MBQ0931415.1 STAS domain-containing protein [Ideonella alba]MBQ0944997.1 STAS domain-containing protein [Ideonella alba]
MPAPQALPPSWRDDAVAAGIITLLLIPQSLAYALLAGLPAELGLAASIVPALAYAAVGTSPVSVMGPGAVLSLMTAQALQHALAVAPEGTSAAALAGVLALETGAVLLLGAALRFDALVALLSVPVLHGFMTGAALTIVITQLPVLAGSSSGGTRLVDVAAGWLGAARPGHLLTLGITVAAITLLWLGRRAGGQAGRAAPLAVMALAIAGAALADASGHGVAVVGALPALAIRPTWPALDPALWRLMLPSAALLALLVSVEHLAVAGSLAARRRQHLVPRRELCGLGGANLLAALSGGMPVGGGLSRSAVAFEANARSLRVGVIVAGLMALSALLLAAPLALLPRAVLAATIVLAASSMLDLQPFRLAWRYAREEFWVMLGVAALTVLASMEVALSVGVALSAALLLQRTADPHVARIGRVPGTEHYRNIERHATEEQPGVVALRIDESLLFTNARDLGSLVQDQLDEDTRRVVLQMSPVNAIDFSGLTALLALDEALHARGVRLDLAEVKGPLMDRLKTADWAARAHGRVFLSMHQALQPDADPR